MSYQQDDSQGAANYAEELKRLEDEINIQSAIKIFEGLAKRAASDKVKRSARKQIKELNAKYLNLTGSYL